MKTILFLDRAPLTLLSSRMHKYMSNTTIIHVAYSKKDKRLLASNGIKADYIYLEMFKDEYDGAEVSDEILDIIDRDIIDNTDEKFNLNSAIQSDRGLTYLTNDECMRSAVAHYNVWTRIFKEKHVDIVYHEPCSLFFNFMGCVLCKKQGGNYTYQIASQSDRYEYAYLNSNNNEYDFVEIKDAFKKYSESPELIDTKRCKAFLNEFRDSQKVFYGGLLSQKKSIWKFLYGALKIKLYKIIKVKESDRIYNNVSYWIAMNNNPWKKIINIIGYKINKIKFVEKLPEGEKYFFYPMHLEPEAVVLYLGDGIYENQIKLIQNIAASLPAGYYLYVKDHPHEYAYRDVTDYKRLMQVPNIRLLSHLILLNNWWGLVWTNTIFVHHAQVVHFKPESNFEPLIY